MILAVITLVAALAWPAEARPTVVDVRLGVHPDKTRFVMEVTDPVDFRVFTLPDPYRVVVDFPEMTWYNSANQTSGTAGSVLNFRYAPYRPGTMRLVLEVAGPVRVREAFMLPPRDGKQPRFVLDLEPVSAAVFASEMSRRMVRTSWNGQPAPRTRFRWRQAPPPSAGPCRSCPNRRWIPSPSRCRRGRRRCIPPQMPAGLRSGGDEGAASPATLAALGAVPLPPKRPGARTDARRVVVLDPGHGESIPAPSA